MINYNELSEYSRMIIEEHNLDINKINKVKVLSINISNRLDYWLFMKEYLIIMSRNQKNRAGMIYWRMLFSYISAHVVKRVRPSTTMVFNGFMENSLRWRTR